MGLLEGIRIIDLTDDIAGSCTRVLADWKAEVIKIEPLQGDRFRTWGKLLRTPTLIDDNPMFEVSNTNKKGIAIDLMTEKGQKILHELLLSADVFVTNYSKKLLDNLKITYEDISTKYPQLIYGYLSGYGSDGPLSTKPNFEETCFWARGGYMGFFGEPNSVPVSPMYGTGSQITGTFLAGGILAALYGRKKTGCGEKVETSLYHGAIWSSGMFNAASNYWENPNKSRFDPDAPLVNMFKSKDGKWFSLAIMEHERYWPDLCKCIDRLDLVDDLRFSSYKNAKNNSAELVKILDESFGKKTMEEWMNLFKSYDIAAAVIFNGHDINNDEQALVNDYIRPVEMQNGKSIRFPTTPCQFYEEGELCWNPSPKLGQDTAEILYGLGYSKEDIRDLCEEQVIALYRAKEDFGCRYVTWEKNNSIALVKFIKSQTLNTLDIDFLKDLSNVIDQIESDEDIKIIIFTGSGKAFMAGADINKFVEMTDEQNQESLDYGMKLFKRIERINKLTIAAVNGVALGAGCEMSLVCDIIIADKKARFGFPEVSLGIIPGGGGTQRLQRHVGKSKAIEMILTGKIINAEEAKDIGLVNEVVQTKDLISRTIILAESILQAPPLAITNAIKAVKAGSMSELDEGLQLELDLFNECFKSNDRKEAMQSFFDGQFRSYTGK